MSQNIEDKANAAEARTQATRDFMQQVRVAARRWQSWGYPEVLTTGGGEGSRTWGREGARGTGSLQRWDDHHEPRQVISS